MIKYPARLGQKLEIVIEKMIALSKEKNEKVKMEGTPFVRHIVYGVLDSADCIKQAAFLI